MNTIPHQSRGARYPGVTIAARDLGVSRYHLWAVISGRRESKPMLKRWNQWLKENPQFQAAQTTPLT